MTGELCEEMRLLIQADVDSELEPGEAARVAAHVEACAACAQLQAQLMALSAQLRAELPRHTAPDLLRAAVGRAVSAREPARARTVRSWWAAGAGAAVAALAAGVALFVAPRPDTSADWMVAAHIRGLQAGHLVDVVSTDRHTVKPWFAGRLPFSPPVKDLVDKGFPLAGGRLDYLPGHTAATLVYKRRQHVIDLFVWPAGRGGPGGGSGARQGYNYVSWQAQGMVFWAVSDLNAAELGEFAKLWR